MPKFNIGDKFQEYDEAYTYLLPTKIKILEISPRVDCLCNEFKYFCELQLNDEVRYEAYWESFFLMSCKQIN
jgi:hypothetical protein